MAELIRLPTPARYAAKGIEFKDWTLDVASVGDNCKRIANGVGDEVLARVNAAGQRRAVTPAEVLEASKPVILELGNICISHREYMSGLRGVKP